MGILNIVVGILSISCGVCGLSAYAFGYSLSQKNLGAGPNPLQALGEYMSQRIPGWFFWEVSKISLSMMLGLILIIAGIGLLRMRAWALAMSISYGIVTICLQVAYLIFELGFVLPATKEFSLKMQGMAQPTPQSESRNVGTALGIVGVGGFQIIYAIVLIFVLFMPQVSQAFASLRGKRRLRDENDLD